MLGLEIGKAQNFGFRSVRVMSILRNWVRFRFELCKLRVRARFVFEFFIDGIGHMFPWWPSVLE